MHAVLHALLFKIFAVQPAKLLIKLCFKHSVFAKEVFSLLGYRHRTAVPAALCSDKKLYSKIMSQPAYSLEKGGTAFTGRFYNNLPIHLYYVDRIVTKVAEGCISASQVVQRNLESRISAGKNIVKSNALVIYKSILCQLYYKLFPVKVLLIGNGFKSIKELRLGYCLSCKITGYPKRFISCFMQLFKLAAGLFKNEEVKVLNDSRILHCLDIV